MIDISEATKKAVEAQKIEFSERLNNWTEMEQYLSTKKLKDDSFFTGEGVRISVRRSDNNNYKQDVNRRSENTLVIEYAPRGKMFRNLLMGRIKEERNSLEIIHDEVNDEISVKLNFDGHPEPYSLESYVQSMVTSHGQEAASVTSNVDVYRRAEKLLGAADELYAQNEARIARADNAELEVLQRLGSQSHQSTSILD